MSQIDPISTEAMNSPSSDDVIDLMLSVMSDGLDHPEIWREIPYFLDHADMFAERLTERQSSEIDADIQRTLSIILAIAIASRGHHEPAVERIEPIAVAHSQSALVQGALFHIHALNDPDNPKYDLAGKVCITPFHQLDVLEDQTHLCCASWLHESAGNLKTTEWRDVWNSDVAQEIRASVHDGSYRFCNKIACPKIQANELAPAQELAGQSSLWRQIIDETITEMPIGPEYVNLAYDRTCNLSCPSCRTSKYAADEATRQSYAEMQETRILPMLKEAKEVFITGSGDPFASKNFRRLMSELTEDEYPHLKFHIMTNGMLFTPKQWESFPTLHGRVSMLKMSIDAATGPTHELLRRGAHWPTMLEHMRFAGDLTKQGLIDNFWLIFTVQQDNFREMGAAVDLAKEMGASAVWFGRITNWGTFSATEYAQKAVFMPSHPEYRDFLKAMQDERLRDPMVMLCNLNEFVNADDNGDSPRPMRRSLPV